MNLGDGKLKLLGTGLAALWLTLGWQGAPADALTVTPANPTIGVGQTQQFTASGALTPTAVAGGGFHGGAVGGDGTVWCRGRDVDGQVGDGTRAPVDCSPGSGGSSAPVRVGGLTGAAAVVAGGYHTCALFGDGTAQCWGRNDDGQLGDGTFTSSSTPLRVGGLTGAAAVSGGFYHTCALLGDGTVQCWGRNAEGQLGNGTTIGSRVPGRVAGLPSATAVSGGFHHTCPLLSDGPVQCWGRNLKGQLRDRTATRSSNPRRV